MTKFYKVTDSQGVTHTRSTKSRSYSHAVVFRWPDHWSGKTRTDAAWSGSLALANKAAAGDVRGRKASPPEIIPAVEITGAEYRAILKARDE